MKYTTKTTKTLPWMGLVLLITMALFSTASAEIGSPKGIQKRVAVIGYGTNMASQYSFAGLFAQQLPSPWFRNESGYEGAGNIIDMLIYDDREDLADVTLIDGDAQRPTASYLLSNFDCVLAFTDNRAGVPLPGAGQAANALVGFVQNGGGRGIVLAGFGFSTSIGFGDALFPNRGLSPLQRVAADNDLRCTPATPCQIGVCPAGCTRDPNTLQCLDDTTGNVCSNMFDVNPHPACQTLFVNVNGPTSSSWANEVTFSKDALACASYENGLPLVAISADERIVGLNVFPANAVDEMKPWFQCLVANAVEFACGIRRR